MAKNQSANEERNSRRFLRRWLPIIVLAIGFATAYSLGLWDYLSIEAISRSRDQLIGFVEANPLAAVTGYVVIYIITVATSIPGAGVLTITGGLMFGTILGGALAAVSATIGAALVFLAARSSLGAWFAGAAGPRVSMLRKGFQENAFSYLLSLRLAAIFPFFLINLAAALFGMNLLPYVVATAIGILPATFAFAYFGSRISSAVQGGGIDISPGLLAAFLVLAVLALVPTIIRKVRGNANPETEEAEWRNS